MPSWKNLDVANGAPNFVAMMLGAGAGRVAQAANNNTLYNNITPANSTLHVHYDANVIGIFAASKAECQNTNNEGRLARTPGWHLRRSGQGPLIGGVANGTGSSRFANLETVTVSNGTSNGTLYCVANATGNLVGFSVKTGGLFPNASIEAYTFNREMHCANVTVTGTGVNYTNTDYIICSNGTINAFATMTTNATGGPANSTITMANTANGGQGIWPAGTANASVVVTVFAANGSATNGSAATFTVNLSNSVGGTVNSVSVGGRAGRVRYECIVENSSVVNNGLYLSALTVTGTTNTFSNSDFIVMSNGTANAFANISTNSIGGIINSAITINSTAVGLWATGTTNTQVVVTAKAANGGASNGVGATFVANLTTSAAFTYLPH